MFLTLNVNKFYAQCSFHTCLSAILLFCRDSRSVSRDVCVVLHKRQATLTNYRDKITITLASEYYERSIMHKTVVYLR